MVKRIFEINMENISFKINWYKNDGNKYYLDKNITIIFIDISFELFFFTHNRNIYLWSLNPDKSENLIFFKKNFTI